MLEIYGNFWNYAQDYGAFVITTNGYVKKNGEAVMGRGIALEAKMRYPWLAASLGEALQIGGNIPYNFYYGSCLRQIVTMPVKPQFGPNGEPGWRVKAETDLIKRSTIALVDLVNAEQIPTVLMPRPGCGNGGLKWEDVKPVIEKYLDDRFTVITFKPDAALAETVNAPV